MTTYYGVSAPLGSGKTTAAIEYAGYSAQAGEKIAIAQPSIRLINQSMQQSRERWPGVGVRAIHSEMCPDVGQAISDHTNASSGGEVLFLTHAALIQAPYWSRRKDWHLIVDEAPQVVYNSELTLPENYHVLIPALETASYNMRYSRLLAGDAAALERIAENRGWDMVNDLFQELAHKLTSTRWDMFVLTEQWERFRTGEITDGKLLVFGLIDPTMFDAFAGVTIMSANLNRTLAYQHLVQNGHIFTTHSQISKKLRFAKHNNGDLLTIHYAIEDGNWSKHRRNRSIEVAEVFCSVNDIIVAGTLDLFGKQDFVWLANKDMDAHDPFGGAGIKLPHSPHGLNDFQHIHCAAALAALNPSPALYSFLDEVAGLNGDEVRQAVYHEAVYQAAGRISTRNLDDQNPKQVVVADRAAAQALAELYPGADVVRLPFADLVPQVGKPGRKRIHPTDAARKKEHRDQRKARLLDQLDRVNGFSSETKSPIGYKVNSSLTNPAFGGSLLQDIWCKHPATHLGGISATNFIEFLRDLHARTVAKEDQWLWAPAEFEAKPGVETGRGLANITALHGVFLDNDGGDLTPDEFAALFPDLMMVIHNSSSSTPQRKKWRAIIFTTCPMTIEVHHEIMLQIRQALNRRGYFDKNQLAKKADKGMLRPEHKHHGFDPSKYTAASMFYLPAQAIAGPEASFFLVFDGGRRKPINPYQWIDKTIINHRPEPEPVAAPAAPLSLVRKDPKLTRALLAMEAEKEAYRQENNRERVDAAIMKWRQHSKGTGHREFFLLAVALAAVGLERSEIEQTLYAEAGFAHGSQSQADRRAAIPGIMRRLAGSHFCSVDD